ncbi:MAG: DUF2341 domain-containing protein [Candidatus Aenigmatarchaeota archaeon]
MNKKILLLSIFFFILFLPPAKAWWNSTWQYRRNITINNTANSNTLTDYQVLVILDTASLISAGKMRSDCGDIRFIDSDETTLLPHYIFTNQTNYISLSYSWGIYGCNSTTTFIRVKVPNIPANSIKTIYMYYGNPDATYNNNLYNIFTDSATVAATLPSNRFGLSCAPYRDSIYCFGGYDGNNYLSQIVRYNVTSNTVTVMSATLPSGGRDLLSCAPYADSIYCFGGYDGTNRFNQIVRYDVISDTATVVSPTLPSGRYGLSCAPYADSIYCFGGQDSSGYLNQIVRYNVTSNTVTTMSATLPSRRDLLSCAPYANSIYCFGGYDGTNYLNQIIRYDVISNTVTVMSATLPSGRRALSCAPYSDSIYCFGGYEGSYLSQIVRYNVTSNTVTVMSATLPSGRDKLSCAPHADSIYCFGGYYGSYLNQIVRYAIKFSSPEPTYLIGEEEKPLTITIFTPTNSTYFISNNFEFKFKATDYSSTVFTLKAYLDDNLEYSNSSYLNDTIVTFYKNLTQAKQYNFTVWANNTNGKISSQTVLFTIKDYEISAITFEQYLYETESYNYSIFFRVNFDLISNITSRLFWNSTDKGYDWQVINSTHIENKKQLTIPLIQANATSVQHYWDYNVTYKNGTNYNSQSSSNTQTILFAYFLSSNAQTQDRTSLIEREDFTNFLTVTTIKNYANLTANSTYRNNNTAMTPTSYNTFKIVFDSGNVTDYNETYPIYSSLIISFQGNSRIMNSESDNITVYKMVLTDCSASSISQTKALNFTLKDEENSNVLTGGTIEITNKITKTNELYREYAFKFSNISSASICIYPSWASYIDDAMIQYKATGYTSRTYFIYATISNTTQNVDLFLLPEGQSYSVIFFIRDENNNPVPDVIIKVQRYFVGENVYKTVAQCKSDNPDGKCATFLRILDVYYREILEKNLTVIKETTPSQIVCQPFESITFCPPYPIPISITTKVLEGIFKRMGNINYDCTINEETNILRCTVSDTSQLMTKAQFIVEKKGALKFETICNQTEFSSAITFTCDLGNRTGNIYRYQVLGYFSEPPVIIIQDILDYSVGLIAWGTIGLLLAFFITSSLFFVGIFNPVVAMIFAFLGLIVGYLFGMIPVSISSLIGLGLVVGIIIWKLRT